MKAFTVIIDCGHPVAFLVEQSLNVAAIKVLHALSSHRFYVHPELARRWNVAMVIATDEWAAEQLRRQPMIRPKGSKMAVLEDER